MEKSEIKKIMGMDCGKSEKMRRLYMGGMEIGSIAKEMGVRYNFVYNVVSEMCRMSDVELRTKERDDSKKDKIVGLMKAGKSNVEIAKELKSNYNYVSKVVKEELRKVK